MARLVTLSNIRTRIRTLGEIRSVYVNDTALDLEINQSAAELYDRLIKASPETYLTEQLINVVSGTSQYNVANDHYKTIGLDWFTTTSPTNYVQLAPYSFFQRDQMQYSSYCNKLPRYRLGAGYLELLPVPSANVTNGVKHHYVPVLASLVNANDTINGVSGWEDWIVYDCCIKLVGGKEEGNAAEWKELIGKLNQRIDNMAAPRNVGEAPQIRDVEEEETTRYGLYYGRGR